MRDTLLGPVFLTVLLLTVFPLLQPVAAAPVHVCNCCQPNVEKVFGAVHREVIAKEAATGFKTTADPEVVVHDMREQDKFLRFKACQTCLSIVADFTRRRSEDEWERAKMYMRRIQLIRARSARSEEDVPFCDDVSSMGNANEGRGPGGLGIACGHGDFCFDTENEGYRLVGFLHDPEQCECIYSCIETNGDFVIIQLAQIRGNRGLSGVQRMSLVQERICRVLGCCTEEPLDPPPFSHVLAAERQRMKGDACVPGPCVHPCDEDVSGGVAPPTPGSGIYGYMKKYMNMPSAPVPDRGSGSETAGRGVCRQVTECDEGVEDVCNDSSLSNEDMGLDGEGGNTTTAHVDEGLCCKTCPVDVK